MTKVPVWFYFTAFILFCIAIAGWILVSQETFSGSPGREGDDVYFENIAYHLAKNEGFKFDFSDPQWQEAYRTGNTEGQNDWVFHVKCRGTTTARSPGLPLFAALVYKTIGRGNWLALRIITSIILALALTVAVSTVYRSFGQIAGLIAMTTLALDYFVLRTAGQFMTEAPGTAIICFLFSACVHLAQTKPDKNSFLEWGLVGVLFGVGTLMRANLNAWFVLIAGSLGIVLLSRIVTRRKVASFALQGLLFGVGVVIVAGPWWLRNCLVTDAFAPFGTSGSFGLVGGYCDEAYHDFGNWKEEVANASQRETLKSPGFFDNSRPRQEYLVGQESSRRAIEWMKENPARLLPMMFMKGVSHLGFYRQPVWVIVANALLFFGAIIGCYSSRKSIGFWVFVVLALSTATTVLAWPHYGRYSIPIRPMIHIASAIGTVVFWRTMFSLWKHRAG